MPSLNLLPEDLKSDGGENGRESAALVLASIFILLAGAVICLGMYFEKRSVLKELAAEKLEVEEVENKIESEINKSETLLVESRVKNIKGILLEHPYISQAVEMIQGKLIEGVYLESFELSKDGKGNAEDGGSLSLKINVVAKSYGVVIEQIAAWRNSFWIENVSIDKISIDSEGKINLSADLKVKRNLIFYREPEWDYGLAFLISKASRHLKIDNYSAVLKRTEEKNKNKIEINFSGVAYSEEALVMFKDNLAGDSSAENTLVSYDPSERDSFERINFKGSVMVTYDDGDL